MYDAQGIYEKLLSVIEDLILNESINEFWVGNYGDFDKLSAKAVRVLKEKYSDIQLNLVVPCLTSEINEYKEQYYRNYDNVIIADIPEKTPRNLRIIKSNEYTIQNAEILVCYVERSFGGAAKTLDYAEKRARIRIINLGM